MIGDELTFLECAIITALSILVIFLLGWWGIGIDPFAK